MEQLRKRNSTLFKSYMSLDVMWKKPNNGKRERRRRRKKNELINHVEGYIKDIEGERGRWKDKLHDVTCKSQDLANLVSSPVIIIHESISGSSSTKLPRKLDYSRLFLSLSLSIFHRGEFPHRSSTRKIHNKILEKKLCPNAFFTHISTYRCIPKRLKVFNFCTHSMFHKNLFEVSEFTILVD